MGDGESSFELEPHKSRASRRLTLRKCCAPEEDESGAVFEREYGLISRKPDASDVAQVPDVLSVGDDGGDSLISSEFGRIIDGVSTSSNELMLIMGSVGCLDE